MAKDNKNKNKKGGDDKPNAPKLGDTLKAILPTIRGGGVILTDEPLVMTPEGFRSERYSPEFYKLIKAKAPNTPLIIVQEDGQSVKQLGWFDALDTGLWYNVINTPAEILDSLV